MNAIFMLLYYALTAFQLILLARVLLSWFPNVDRSNPLVRFVFEITEPILQPIRNLMPRDMMIDFSPLIVFLVISLLQRLLFMR
ncbi:YggT family protein [Anaerolineae bacterium CFX9]|mgnify:CR=1 FL=1|jgi:YggT family protein|nr:YggT family protein [Kamptonema cortianum]MDL1899383.1 YggT family protein [Anaerolineae bacterium CFX9]